MMTKDELVKQIIVVEALLVEALNKTDFRRNLELNLALTLLKNDLISILLTDNLKAA